MTNDTKTHSFIDFLKAKHNIDATEDQITCDEEEWNDYSFKDIKVKIYCEFQAIGKAEITLNEQFTDEINASEISDFLKSMICIEKAVEMAINVDGVEHCLGWDDDNMWYDYKRDFYIIFA